MLDHKINVSEVEKIEIIQIYFSDHNGVELDINNKRKTRINNKKKSGQLINIWKLNVKLLND